MTSTICFLAQFTASKVGVDGLTVTWDVERITRSDGTRNALVTGGANSIAVGRRGLYGYVLAGADLTLYDYVATAITATTTVDQMEIPASYTVLEARTVQDSVAQTGDSFALIGTAGAGLTALGDTRLANLDATVSSRSTYAGGAVASVTGDVGGKVLGGGASVITGTGAQAQIAAGGIAADAIDAASIKADATTKIAAGVWNALTATYAAAGSFGAAVGGLVTSLAGLVAAVWAYASRTLTQSAAEVEDAVVGATLNARIAVTFRATLTGLTISSNWSKILVSVKENPDEDTEDNALLRIQKSAASPYTGDGLQRIQRAAGTASDASLVVNQVAGTVAILVKDEATALWGPLLGATYDVKEILDDGSSNLLTTETFNIRSTASRAVS